MQSNSLPVSNLKCLIISILILRALLTQPAIAGQKVSCLKPRKSATSQTESVIASKESLDTLVVSPSSVRSNSLLTGSIDSQDENVNPLEAEDTLKDLIPSYRFSPLVPFQSKGLVEHQIQTKTIEFLNQPLAAEIEFEIHYRTNLFFKDAIDSLYRVGNHKAIEALEPLIARQQHWFLFECDSLQSLRKQLKIDPLLGIAIQQLELNGTLEEKWYTHQVWIQLQIRLLQEKFLRLNQASIEDYVKLDEFISTEPLFTPALEQLSVNGNKTAQNVLHKRKMVENQKLWFLENNPSYQELVKVSPYRLYSIIAVMDIAQAYPDPIIRDSAQKLVDRLNTELNPYVQKRLRVRLELCY